MGKKSRAVGEEASSLTTAKSHAAMPFLVEEKAVDPSLALLFASSVRVCKYFIF
jgi:hypothetical protein